MVLAVSMPMGRIKQKYWSEGQNYSLQFQNYSLQLMRSGKRTAPGL